MRHSHRTRYRSPLAQSPRHPTRTELSRPVGSRSCSSTSSEGTRVSHAPVYFPSLQNGQHSLPATQSPCPQGDTGNIPSLQHRRTSAACHALHARQPPPAAVAVAHLPTPTNSTRRDRLGRSSPGPVRHIRLPHHAAGIETCRRGPHSVRGASRPFLPRIHAHWPVIRRQRICCPAAV